MGSVSMMISADSRMSIVLAVNFKAMVAVKVASTLAFTPLPSPSERTETMRPSWLDLLGKEDVSGDQLAILGPLAGIDLDKALRPR